MDFLETFLEQDHWECGGRTVHASVTAEVLVDENNIPSLVGICPASYAGKKLWDTLLKEYPGHEPAGNWKPAPRADWKVCHMRRIKPPCIR